jgi:hypothetical protein
MASGLRFVDQDLKITALTPGVPSGATPKWVSLKGYHSVQIMIKFLNTTTVTGSAITLNQATAVAGTGSKALAFTTMFAVADSSAGVIPAQVAVVSNTFTTSAVNSKSGWYFIEVRSTDLDMKNGFDCLQVGVGNATASTIDVLYTLRPRYSGEFTSFQDPTVD